MSSRARSLVIVLLICAGTAGLIWARREAHGLRNALSPTFWSDHVSGRDIYDADRDFLRHGDPNVPEVALTFDDGPHPDSANQILDVLRANQVKATFFLVGSRIKEHPEIVRRMVDEGHAVGNHTQDHLRLTELTSRQMENEIRDCQTNFSRAVPGARMELFRPPGMRFNAEVLRAARRDGYTIVGWNDAAKDFISADHPLLDPSLIRRHVADQVENGSIILLHDIPATAEALGQVISEIRAKGFRFVTIPQMLSRVLKSQAKMKP